MNGIVCEAIYPRISRDLGGIPIRNFYFDGTQSDLDRDLGVYMERIILLPIRLRATALQAESQSRQLGRRPAALRVPRRTARPCYPFEVIRSRVPFCPRIQHNSSTTAIRSRRHAVVPQRVL
jgi:hypothetical protein